MREIIQAYIIDQKKETLNRTLHFDGKAITYNFSGQVLPTDSANQDFAAIALIFYAMRQNKNLHIEGTVSDSLLSNLYEFQHAFQLWKPGKYNIIDVTADNIEQDIAPRGKKAVMAYSGGADANFTMLRHMMKVAGPRTREISNALLVHGFDIPLEQEKMFNFSATENQKILGIFDIPLTIIKTNWRDIVCDDWETEFGAGLVACLSQFNDISDYGLLGSDEDYAHLLFPWGSNPVTNPLLNGRMRIETDGAAFGRSKKIALVAQRKDVADKIRVCWEGVYKMQTGNCGKCEKCIRTQLNFLANGKMPGRSLGGTAPALWRILTINIRNSIQRGYLLEIIQTADSNSINAPWLIAAKTAYHLCPYTGIARKVLGKTRKGLKSLIRMMKGKSSLIGKEDLSAA